MNHRQPVSPAFWAGILAMALTAATATWLSASPTAHALPTGRLAQAYPTATATPAPDLVADKIEVTQAIQDLNNSVRLVQDKRTFVRFHVHSSSGAPVTTARLIARLGATNVTLSPINPGGAIAVHAAPDRNAANHAFLFELPSGFRQNTVSLEARVNPNASPVEPSYANNQVNTAVTFEPVPRVNLVIYQISYNIGATTYAPSNAHRDQMVSWLRRAYPLSDLRVWSRTLHYGAGAATGDTLTNPTCGVVNTRLGLAKIVDIIFNWLGANNIPTSSHYYGMVSDEGGFMRGCAMGIPHTIAAGPAGNASWDWDFDGSYGDWYGGHELLHTYGRAHAMFCGATAGAAYPYALGRISPSTAGNSAIYGFDIESQAIYGSTWKDVMTYCANQWISDFTYEGAMSYFKANPVRADDVLVRLVTGDRLLIGGTIEPATGATLLEPVFKMPEVAEVTARMEGDYAIVLRNSAAEELARYPFTPITSESGPAALPDAREVVYLIINELVPSVNGATRIDIEGPDSVLLGTLEPGSAAPTVTLTAPNGGQMLTGHSVEVTWTASDADGDPLTFMIQYSPNGGQSWMVAAQNVTGNRFLIDSSNLMGGNQARFRVWASDGLNTASDESDADNIVPDHAPNILLLSPQDGDSFALGATVALEGQGYDLDRGPLQGAALAWLSDIDGALGIGELISISTLTPGAHHITLRTPDEQGGFVQESVQITVLAGSQQPPVADRLSVGPHALLLDRNALQLGATITVDNHNAAATIGWTATTAANWLTLGKTSGMTPDSFAVTYTGDLPPGVYATAVVLTQSGSDDQVEVPVSLTLQETKIFLPTVNKP